MRVVVQRVSRASVEVDGETVSSIGPGLCLLVGVARDDDAADAQVAVDKIANMRIFGDDGGKMNLSVTDVGGEVLVVSQFTLLGDARRGRRPSFTRAASREHANRLISELTQGFRLLGIPASEGVFGASMAVELVNEGPVTMTLDVTGGLVS